MSTVMRANFLALGLAAALIAGCDKSGTTGSGGGAGTTGGAPGKSGGADASAKLVGVWESVEEAKKDETKKDGPDDKSTVEFKKDGGLSIAGATRDDRHLDGGQGRGEEGHD